MGKSKLNEILILVFALSILVELCSTVALEHVLPPKNAMSPMGFDPGTSRIVS